VKTARLEGERLNKRSVTVKICPGSEISQGLTLEAKQGRTAKRGDQSKEIPTG